MPSSGNKEYTFGHSNATTATHAARTANSDAAFIIPYIKATDRILDVGCGPGTITFGFAEYVPEGSVTGTDYTPEIVQRASAFALSKISEDDGKSRGKVDFVLGNVLERLPFEDGSFDIVFSSQMLTHMRDDDSIIALKEMRRVLKPGGICSSRDGAFLHFWPPSFNLETLYVGNMFKAMGVEGLSGPKTASRYRAAGFDVDGGKVKIGTGSNCYTAGKEATKAYADRMTGRLKKGDGFRLSWEKAGISDEEIEEASEAMRKWSETEDAWAAILQSEVVAWK